ncbi:MULTISPECIES: hypothetical protein [unclassified Streptomyces]|uniref:hypothetical protein n=1 Tax=unclassified Streptomyces TaxID=2593676 RepID=UPI00381F42F1
MRLGIGSARALAAAALLPTALLAAGCGIQSTDVIAVGGPATAHVEGSEGGSTVLYFTGPDGLMPVVRSGRGVGPALPLLFAGPGKAEAAAGVRTELPPLRGPASMNVAEGMVTVVLGQEVGGLSPLAQRQIACTVLHQVARSGHVRVTITGTDARSSLSPIACET